jgi:intracellular septation protein A
MGCAMVRETPSTPEQESGLAEPEFRRIFLTGLPGFLREGFLPLGAFYVALRLSGLATAIVAAAIVSLLIYGYERKIGRNGLLVRLSLAFVAVQSIVGLLAHSTTVYLAQPVIANLLWGAMFLVSAAVRRPLAGALACAWYPFPREFRETPQFKRVFGIESVVWGAYFVGRSLLRLLALLQGSLESFLAIVFITGTPAMLLLMVWSIRYAIRELNEEDPPPSPPRLDAVRQES